MPDSGGRSNQERGVANAAGEAVVLMARDLPNRRTTTPREPAPGRRSGFRRRLARMNMMIAASLLPVKPSGDLALRGRSVSSQPKPANTQLLMA